MNNDLYNFEVSKRMKNTSETNYTKRTKRELTIFYKKETKKIYIESKIKRFLSDYSIDVDIKWSNKNKFIKIDKRGVIVIPEFKLENRYNEFLTEIVYSLALSFHYAISKQNLIKIDFENILDFMTTEYFGIENNNNIKEILSTKLPLEVKENKDYIKSKEGEIKTEKNNDGNFFISFVENTIYFYMFLNKKHTMLKFKKNIA